MNIQKALFIILSCTLLVSCSVPDNKNEEKVKGFVKCAGLNSKVDLPNRQNKTIDSINHLLQWEKTDLGLWKSKNGDLAIKTQEGDGEGIFVDRYITELCCEGNKIKDIIDTPTFKYLGSSFYKDNRNVYTHYAMLDGGKFWIVEEADAKTFKVIGNTCYAKDKNHIYVERTMKMDSVDYKTFKTCDECGCYAKDKNGYYCGDRRIETSGVDEETKKMIDKLKNL